MYCFSWYNNNLVVIALCCLSEEWFSVDWVQLITLQQGSMLLEAKNEQSYCDLKCLELVCERILVIIITSWKYFYKMNGDIGMTGW